MTRHRHENRKPKFLDKLDFGISPWFSCFPFCSLVQLADGWNEVPSFCPSESVDFSSVWLSLAGVLLVSGDVFYCRPRTRPYRPLSRISYPNNSPCSTENIAVSVEFNTRSADGKVGRERRGCGAGTKFRIFPSIAFFSFFAIKQTLHLSHFL